MFKITILYGAIREGRLSIRAAKALHNALLATGKADITFIDIKDFNLPVMEARFKDMENPPESLRAISKALLEADGIVLVTPEYNHSYSGALKNTVDYFTREWNKKPIGVCCSSEGKWAGINASHHLQELILEIRGFPLNTKFLVPNLATSLDEEGKVLDEAVQKTLDRFITDYLWFVEAISNQHKKGH